MNTDGYALTTHNKHIGEQFNLLNDLEIFCLYKMP